MTYPYLEQSQASVTPAPVKDLVIRGLCHPELLDFQDVQDLCECLAVHIFDRDEKATILCQLEAAGIG